MDRRLQRLHKLLKVQQQLKALHERRHAGFLSEANAAGLEADDVAQRLEAQDSLARVFPELYYQRLADALRRKAEWTDKARQEADLLALQNARNTIVERAYLEAAQQEERRSSERELLELIQNKLAT